MCSAYPTIQSMAVAQLTSRSSTDTNLFEGAVIGYEELLAAHEMANLIVAD